MASSICVPAEEEEEGTTIGTGSHGTPHFSISPQDSDVGPDPVIIHEEATEEAIEDLQSQSAQESNELSAIPEEEVVCEEGTAVKGSGEEVGRVEGGSGRGEAEVGVTDESGGTQVEIVVGEESGEGRVTSEDTVTVGAGVKSEIGDAGVKSEVGDAGVKSEVGDAGVRIEVGDAGVRIEVGESGEGNEKHEDDDVGKEDAEKMDLSEVPSVLTTSSEGEVAEGEMAEEEVRAC